VSELWHVAYTRAAMRRLLILLLLAGCTTSRQLVVVTTLSDTSTTGTLRRYDRHDGRWQQAGAAVPVIVGRTGVAEAKHEGDGKSPAGSFAIGPAFGFAPSAPEIRMPYRALTPRTECVDDTASPFYNRIVERDASSSWTSSEKMRQVGVYKWGAVIDYNAKRTPGAGSCIFLHIAGSGPTAGCTSLREADLLDLLHWLDPSARPRIVQLTEAEYARRRAAWRLP
jgi:D-alanyl-D-alanine dipeptidase